MHLPLREEVIICGFTEPKGRRKYIGALVLGTLRSGKLTFVGQVGVGFDAETLAALRRELKIRETLVPPFEKKPKTNAPVQWVLPELICEVGFREWTRHGLMRFPIFLGLKKK